MGDRAAAGATPAGAERKLVTVLLADVDEAVEDFAEPDPEDVGRMLARQLARVRAEVEAFGGTVEQTVGGRTVAVFGVPRTRTDDPERAVRAALAIRDALGGGPAGAEVGRLIGRLIRVQVAVATGEALVRGGEPPGGPRQRVLGDPVTACARLLEGQRAGTVLVTEATARATERAIGYAAAQGSEPPGTWYALGPRPGPAVPRALPLVARGRELDLLLERFATVRASGSPQLVTVLGPPGIGKSRLVAELAARLRSGAGPVAWRQGRSLPYGDGAAFRPLSAIVRAEAGIGETDPPARAERLVDRAARRAVREPDAATWVARQLHRLVGPAAPARAGAGDREEGFAAWRRFLYGTARRRPLVLAVEDLHWADDALLDFLEGLVAPEAAADAGPVPLLVVATARPELLERRPGWGAHGPGPGGGTTDAGTTVVLAPLSDGDTGRLLAALLARHGLPAGAAGGGLLARVGGNPLFAEEYVRMLADRGAAAGQGEAERGPAAAAAIPETVHAIIAARLDALPPDEKAVLQDAAVLGQAGWAGALTEVGGHDLASLEGCLRRLERRELLHRTGRASDGEVEYAFSHVLVRDVAYGQILRAERAGKHRRAAAWIEALSGDRGGDRAELLAYHYRAALGFARAAGQDEPGLAARARAALRDAGDRAAALGAYGAAARYHGQALELCPPGDPERPELELRLGRARCQGEGAGGETLASARDGFLERGERVLAAEAEMLLGELAFLHGRGDERAAHLDRALALVAGAAPSRSRAAVLKGCMMHLVIASRHADASRLAEEVLAMAGALGLADLEADALGTIGLAKVDGGDAGGIAELERAIAVAGSLASPGSVVWYLNLAYAHAALGDLGASSAALSAAEEAAERFGSARRLRSIRLQRVAECYWTGRWDEALATADEHLASSRGDPERHYLEWELHVWRGRVHLARGRDAVALGDARAALELATRAADPQALNPARAFHARGRAAARGAAAARTAVAELLEGLGGSILGPDLGVDLPVVLAALGEPAGVLDARGIPPSPWLEAARALVDGDPERATAVYAGIGSRPDEADARLAAAARLLAAGHLAEGEAELAAATAFFTEVGAVARVAEADALRRRPAGARRRR